MSDKRDIASEHLDDPLDYLYEECPPGEMTAAKRHLAACPACREEMKKVREAVKVYRRVEPPKPPSGLAARVAAKALAEAGVSASAPSAPVAAVPSEQLPVAAEERLSPEAAAEREFARLKEEVLGEARGRWRTWLFHPAWTVAASLIFICTLVLHLAPRDYSWSVPAPSEASVSPARPRREKAVATERRPLPAPAPRLEREQAVFEAKTPVLSEAEAWDEDAGEGAADAPALRQSPDSVSATDERAAPPPPSTSAAITTENERIAVPTFTAPARKAAPQAAPAAKDDALSVETSRSRQIAGDRALQLQYESPPPASAALVPDGPSPAPMPMEEGIQPDWLPEYPTEREEDGIQASAGPEGMHSMPALSPEPTLSTGMPGTVEEFADDEQPAENMAPPFDDTPSAIPPPAAPLGDSSVSHLRPPPSSAGSGAAALSPPALDAATTDSAAAYSSSSSESLTGALTLEDGVVASNAVLDATNAASAAKKESGVIVDLSAMGEPPQLIERPTPIDTKQLANRLAMLAGMSIDSGDLDMALEFIAKLRRYDSDTADLLAKIVADKMAGLEAAPAQAAAGEEPAAGGTDAAAAMPDKYYSGSLADVPAADSPSPAQPPATAKRSDSPLPAPGAKAKEPDSRPETIVEPSASDDSEALPSTEPQADVRERAADPDVSVIHDTSSVVAEVRATAPEPYVILDVPEVSDSPIIVSAPPDEAVWPAGSGAVEPIPRPGIDDAPGVPKSSPDALPPTLWESGGARFGRSPGRRQASGRRPFSTDPYVRDE